MLSNLGGHITSWAAFDLEQNVSFLHISLISRPIELRTPRSVPSTDDSIMSIGNGNWMVWENYSTAAVNCSSSPTPSRTLSAVVRLLVLLLLTLVIIGPQNTKCKFSCHMEEPRHRALGPHGSDMPYRQNVRFMYVCLGSYIYIHLSPPSYPSCYV